MKKIAVFALVLISVNVGISSAQKPETFEEAKTLSANQNKPILLEFFRDD